MGHLFGFRVNMLCKSAHRHWILLRIQRMTASQVKVSTRLTKALQKSRTEQYHVRAGHTVPIAVN